MEKESAKEVDDKASKARRPRRAADVDRDDTKVKLLFNYISKLLIKVFK